MKILHVTPYFAPAWSFGGTPRAVFELAKQQVKQGHEVHILTTDANTLGQTPLKLQEKKWGLKIWRVKNLNQFLAWNFHFVTPLQLPIKLSSIKFDVIHLHEVRCLLHLLALKQITAAKVVLSPWGTLPDNQQFIWVKKIIDTIFFPILRQKINLALAQTKHEQQILKQQKIGRQIKIVALGIDQLPSSLPSKQLARKKLNLPTRQFIFLYLGRFSLAKGLDILLTAFAKVAKTKPKILLVLIGRDDGYLKMMKKLISKLELDHNVKILPPLYDQQRFLAYRAADFFISTPTIYEETSTTCLESLACGRPVLTTPQAEIPFLHRHDGVFYTLANEIEIYRHMLSLISKSKKIKLPQMKQFLWSTIAKGIYES